MNILIEYVIAFILIYVINYFTLVKKKLRYKKDSVPPELTYLKKIYNINIRKIRYKNFVYTYSLINTFIISTIYIIVIYLIKGVLLKIIAGIVLLMLLTVICYGLLGRYYLWKEGRDNV